MKNFECVLNTIVSLLWGNWLIILFLFLGLYCSINTKFIQFRKFTFIFKKFFLDIKKNKDEHSGEVKGIHGVILALASCVGSGNIVGVATAILMGGAGALLWMWVAAFLGMATKFSEIVLGMLYRDKNKNKNNEYIGGPMYYISMGLKSKALGTAVAIFLFIQNTSGIFIQSNTISNSISSISGVNSYVIGITVAILVSIVISGGLKRLVETVEKIVPFMALVYILFGLLVICFNYKELPLVFKNIFIEAFTIKAGAGATMGTAMRYGIARGIYSNEAGEGSAAVIHSTVTNAKASEQGLYGIIEVFIDTIIICTITGLVILTSGIPLENGVATSIVSQAFGSVFSPLHYVVVICLVLFCFTSMLSQWYFGHVSLTYLKCNQRKIKAYQMLFPIAIITGSVFTSDIVWLIQDLALFLLIMPNIAALLILAPIIKNNMVVFEKSI
ncbi:MAG: alanine/glycine:cation symporter family protein [Lachnospirales bacterium]